MNDIKWAKSEKAIAREAFDAAYDRECETIIAELRSRVRTLRDPDALWDLHNFLSARRREMDDKYDFRYSQLLFVFSRLVKDGLLDLRDLEGLSEEKLAIIEQLSKA